MPFFICFFYFFFFLISYFLKNFIYPLYFFLIPKKIGFGYGKGPTALNAVRLATRDAERHAFAVPLVDGAGVAHAWRVKQDGAIVEMKPRPRGAGLSAGANMITLCEAFGLRNVMVKSHNSRSRKAVVRAFFKGMYLHATSEAYEAAKLGKKWFDSRKTYT